MRENCEIQRLKALFHRLAKTPKEEVHLWVEMDKSPEFGCGLTSPLYWDLGSAVLEHTNPINKIWVQKNLQFKQKKLFESSSAHLMIITINMMMITRIWRQLLEGREGAAARK